MRLGKFTIITVLAIALIACGTEEKPSKPLDTLKAYHEAVLKKDATTMKLLLSDASLKLHQQEAQAQGLTLDDIVMRDTLFPVDQKVFGYKNEKIEGNNATVEVKNNFSGYDIIYLVKEDGIWKIDKKATSDQMIQDVDAPTTDFENQLDQDRQKIDESMGGTKSSDPAASPSVSPDASASPAASPNVPDNSPPPATGDFEPTLNPTP